jgi:hypothetical protein
MEIAIFGCACAAGAMRADSERAHDAARSGQGQVWSGHFLMGPDSKLIGPGPADPLTPGPFPAVGRGGKKVGARDADATSAVQNLVTGTGSDSFTRELTRSRC